VLFVSVLASISPATAIASQIVSGRARIVDGDTVIVSGEKIRLNGIDAPETDQVCLKASGARWLCGIEARERLGERAANKLWSCEVVGRDGYERWLATCTVDGENINRWMVHAGWALSFKRYSRLYDGDEHQARTASRGLWSGAFIAPWDWRSKNRSTRVLGALEVPIGAQNALLSLDTDQEAPQAKCSIKGNLNRAGACVYHAPGGRFYARTKIDQSKGERWFCTPDEAEAAGCRRSPQ
jgi:endonuclease YncB( thermonuclease family)